MPFIEHAGMLSLLSQQEKFELFRLSEDDCLPNDTVPFIRNGSKFNAIRPTLPEIIPFAKQPRSFILTDRGNHFPMDYSKLSDKAINQHDAFHDVAKHFVAELESDDTYKEMSLLEAFDNRFKSGQSALNRIMPQTSGIVPNEPGIQSIHDGVSPHPISSHFALEQMVRNTKIPVNVQDYIQTHPGNDPVRAMSCLYRAQRREKLLQEIAKSLGYHK